MRILVLNCGSASVKYQLFETSHAQAEAGEDRSLARGVIEGFACYEGAVRSAIAAAVTDPGQIDAVGHRVVHGGERFSSAVVLDDRVAAEIEAFNELAPLHNPPNIRGYRAARLLLPDCPHVAVFDTAFHQSIPPRAYLYGLPYGLYRRHHLRRFGFHGSSHRYVAERYTRLRGQGPGPIRIITCHLGNGCSVAAIEDGKSIDTSMGFTPLEGVLMGTRGGDLDAGALLHLMECEGLDPAAARRLLNHECGLLGLSGISHDMRELLAAACAGDVRASLALDVYCYRVRKYIGAYFAALNGAEAVIFTGGVGENAAPVRERICESLDALGIALDPEKNCAAAGEETEISAHGARTRVWVIPTREELMIARETLAAAFP